MKVIKYEMVDGEKVRVEYDTNDIYGPPTREQVERRERMRETFEKLGAKWSAEVDRIIYEYAERLWGISDYAMLVGALAQAPKAVTPLVIKHIADNPAHPLHRRAGEIEKDIHRYLTAPRRPWWWPFG